MKKYLVVIMMIALFMVSTACAKLPEQVRQGKAFTDKGFVVQDNLKYEVKEYNFGKVVGTEVVESGTYYNVRLEVSNVGKTADKIPLDKIELETSNEKLKPEVQLMKKANEEAFTSGEIKPESKVTGWLVFPTSKMPASVKLHIKDSVLEIQ